MAAEQITSDPEVIDEPIPKRDDQTKFKRLWGLKHLTHEAIMLDKIQKEQKLVMDLAVQTRDGTLGDSKQTEAFPEGEDGMGVQVGNESHHHVTNNFYGSEKPEPTPAEEAVVSVAKDAASSGLKKLAPVVLGAALPIMGGGAYALVDYFLNKPETVNSTTINNPNEDREPVIDIKVHPADEDEQAYKVQE